VYPLDVTMFIGARPNLPKAATVLRAFDTGSLRHLPVRLRVVHTGQHSAEQMGLGYAHTMGVRIDEVLESPAADEDGRRLAGLVAAVDGYLSRVARPDLAIVLGDVNSTLAAALVLGRRGIPIVHVEAGLRSGAAEPEEINRKIITAVADVHLAPSRQAVMNLRRENVPDDRIYFVGNAHTETFLLGAADRATTGVLERLGLRPGGYTLLSVHKTPTVQNLGWLFDLVRAASRLPSVVWVVHPSAREMLLRNEPSLLELPSLRYLGPQPYYEFGRLLTSAACVITDSAGMQEETTVSGVPCVTVGAPTARPETMAYGTNTFTGFDVPAAEAAAAEALRVGAAPSVPEHWDAHVSRRISQALTSVLTEHADTRPDTLRPVLSEPSTAA